MPEIRTKPPIQYLYSHKLSNLTGIPQGRWMMGSNHPDLGGGFLFSLGHLSRKETCILVKKSGLYLWHNGENKVKSHWLKAEREDIINWSKKTLEATKSLLHSPTMDELREVMFLH